MNPCDNLHIYWLPTPFASFPFTSPPVRHRVPSGFNWTLHKPSWSTDITIKLAAMFSGNLPSSSIQRSHWTTANVSVSLSVQLLRCIVQLAMEIANSILVAYFTLQNDTKAVS
jgi:hypothetical protein